MYIPKCLQSRIVLRKTYHYTPTYVFTLNIHDISWLYEAQDWFIIFQRWISYLCHGKLWIIFLKTFKNVGKVIQMHCSSKIFKYVQTLPEIVISTNWIWLCEFFINKSVLNSNHNFPFKKTGGSIKFVSLTLINVHLQQYKLD